MREHSFKGFSRVPSAPSVITQVSTHKTASLPDHLFFIILIKREKEKSHINNSQFEQPYSSTLIQILYLYAIG